MGNIRFKALERALNRRVSPYSAPSGKLTDYYGSNTFNHAAMREFLPQQAYQSLMYVIESGEQIDRAIADQVAASMKAWAVSKGATHYTHWFHPLTGSTAEKHDSFMSPVDGGRAIEDFRGGQLIQQEPDASSFPSGGIRNTFEARGYTAWDPTSPAFILDGTLCIPTIFVSYTGEALDYKTPLIKAVNAVDKAAVEVCRYFDRAVNKVSVTLGWEQEYFLVDSALNNARPDIMLTGRTVFGHASAKDQQLSDHYFGTIPERVQRFMQDFEEEAHKLGIPVKTRHNEVAPSQFECAPVYEEVNLAVDHNQLLMHLLKRVSSRHDLTVLLHEKPYADINGSGKHNNWSLETNLGENLLSPGKTPKTNLRFLVFLVNVVQALNRFPGLMFAHIASAGNEHRLGAHEAPPAIISAFIGTELTRALEMLQKDEKSWEEANGQGERRINIPKVPEILPDNTDRNRTSPFAFTGNKFEFRAVGSTANCAKPMIALNLIVADQLKRFKVDVDTLIDSGIKKEDALVKVLNRYIDESKRILFEGNNYSEEWVIEAAKRGLPNIKSTPDAIDLLICEDNIRLFEEHNVLSKRELMARREIQHENYVKKVQIEARVVGDLALNHIIPTAIRYQNTLIENVKGLKEVLDNKTYVNLSNVQLQSIKDISMHITAIRSMVMEMIEQRKEANSIEAMDLRAHAYHNKVLPFFIKIREHVDSLELMVDDELWPLPKYRELLFFR